MSHWNPFKLLLAAAKAPMLIGGQAVMEGVMMKSKHHLATAVRKPSGNIKVRYRKEISFSERYKLDKIPFVRGIFVLFETMIIGMRELNWSAAEADEEDQVKPWEMALAIVIAIVIALAIFKLLPLFLATIVTERTAGGNWMLNLLDGTIKVIIFVAYIGLIGLLPDMKRLFQYHGAEHKSVNCYEAGKTLTPKNVQQHTRFQARCGTTFVIYVIMLSILVYLLIPFGSGFWTKYALRILLLPVIAGIAYEWIRFAGKCYSDRLWVRIISAPGMAFQAMTTREPDLKQIAVAIAALERVLKKEGLSPR